MIIQGQSPARDVEAIAHGIIRNYAQRANAILQPLDMARGLVAVAPYFLDVMSIGVHLGAPHATHGDACVYA